MNFPGDTRFATNFIMLEREVAVKDALESTVIDPDFKVLKNVQAPRCCVFSKQKWWAKKAYADVAERVTERVKNEGWWKRAKGMVTTCTPMIKVVPHRCDENGR